MPSQGRRKLAAIMFTDIVGYSRVMQEDETRGRMLRARHREVFEHCTNRYEGKIVQYFGDGTLSVFDSAVAAVECAAYMQKSLKTYPQVPLRIGVHLGDIHYDETEVYGHGVNVAARIEPVCNPGGVFISHKVNDEIHNHPFLSTKSLGVFRFKNIEQDLELFAVEGKDISSPNSDDIAYIHEYSQRVHLSESGKQSRAVRRFINDRRKRKRIHALKIVGITLIALLAIAAFTKSMFFGYQEMPQTGNASVAVLPFANMTPDENDYFSDGMTEDILTRLSKIEDLSVTSRTSVMQYKDTEKTTRQIGRELGVDHILEGSVRKYGDEVRITAQLIDARTDSHVWAQTYDEQITNIFDVQSQVASDIAAQLSLELSDQEKEAMSAQPSSNVSAYDLYLKGRELYRQYSPEKNVEAISLFKEALEIEPHYAYAFAGLGDAYAQKAFQDGMNRELLDTAIFMGAKAIESDPNLSEGYKALGLAFHYQGDYEKAMTQYMKALDLDPYNDMASNNLGMIQREKGDYAEAAKWAKRTFDINKAVPTSVANMAEIYLEVNEDELANVVVTEGIAANPKAPKLHALKSKLDLRAGKYEDAQLSASIVIQELPDEPMGYDLQGNIYLYQESWAQAAESFESARAMSHSDSDKLVYDFLSTFALNRSVGVPVPEEYLARVMAGVDSIEKKNDHHKQIASIIRAAIEAEKGDFDIAVQALDTACSYNWLDYPSGMNHPIFSDINGLPEFKVVMAKMKVKSDSLQAVVLKATREGT